MSEWESSGKKRRGGTIVPCSSQDDLLNEGVKQTHTDVFHSE